MKGGLPSYATNLTLSYFTDPDISVRRKTVFMLFNLLYSTESEAQEINLNERISFPNDPKPDPSSTSTASLVKSALTSDSSQPTILQTLVSELHSPTPHGVNGDQPPDVDLREKIARCLVSYVDLQGAFDADQKKLVAESLEKEGGGRFDLDPKDWGVLRDATKA